MAKKDKTPPIINFTDMKYTFGIDYYEYKNEFYTYIIQESEYDKSLYESIFVKHIHNKFEHLSIGYNFNSPNEAFNELMNFVEKRRAKLINLQNKIPS